MKSLRLLASVALLAASFAHAQIVGPGLTGINRITLPGNSDSLIAASFARPDAAAGLVLSVSGNRVFFKGALGWSTNQFVAGGAVTDTFYLLIGSGPKEGAIYTITANDGNSVTVELEGDTLTGLAVDHRLAIVPYWSLSTLFPGGAGVHETLATDERRTEILFPNYNSTGINASVGPKFYFWGGSWREVGQGMAVRDHEIVYPDAYFIVRHNIGTATEFVSNGQVLPGKLITWLGVNATGKRDNYVGLERPTAITLAASGLVASGAFAASPTPGNRTDELLVFDNTVARQNKAASVVYYYWSNAWRKVGGGTASFDGALLKPGAGFIIRKNTAATAAKWTNTPNY